MLEIIYYAVLGGVSIIGAIWSIHSSFSGGSGDLIITAIWAVLSILYIGILYAILGGANMFKSNAELRSMLESEEQTLLALMDRPRTPAAKSRAEESIRQCQHRIKHIKGALTRRLGYEID